MKTPEHIIPAYNLPDNAVTEAVEAAQSTEAAEATEAAATEAEATEAAHLRAPEGRMACKEILGVPKGAILRRAPQSPSP
jgi:hypothetical protein